MTKILKNLYLMRKYVGRLIFNKLSILNVDGTHSAEGLKLFIGDKTSIQSKQEDRGIGQHAT